MSIEYIKSDFPLGVESMTELDTLKAGRLKNNELLQSLTKRTGLSYFQTLTWMLILETASFCPYMIVSNIFKITIRFICHTCFHNA